MVDGILWIALAAFSGGIAASLLGWLDSAEPFNIRKFGASLVRALVSAVVFGAAYQMGDEGVTATDIGLAFAAGAGIDALGNRLSGSLRSLLS